MSADVSPAPPLSEAEPAPAPLSSEDAAVIAGPDVRVQARVHMLSVTLLARGGTPLVSQPVLVLDPEDGAVVAGPFTTDPEGHLVCEVPEDRAYALRILDEDADATPAPEEQQPEERSADTPRIYVRLLTPALRPLARTPIEVRGDSLRYQGETNDDGDIEIDGCAAGCYTLVVAGAEYPVPTLFESDLVEDPDPYTLVADQQGGARV